jgi:hypothetical protein
MPLGGTVYQAFLHESRFRWVRRSAGPGFYEQVTELRVDASPESARRRDLA